MKTKISLILVVLLTGLCFAQSSYDAASEAIKKGDFKTALNIANQVLLKDSTDTAVKILVDLTSHDTTDKGAYESLGDAYSKMNVPELSLSNYEHAERLDSTNVKIKYKIGETLYKEQSYTDAANKFLQAIAIDSNYAPAYLMVGEILYYAKQYPNAAYYLNKYLQFDPKNEKAIFYTANSFFLMNNFEKAVQVSQQGIQYNPANTDLKRILALSLVYDKKLDDASKYLDQLPDSLITARQFAQIGLEYNYGKMDSLSILYLKKAIDKDTSLISNLAETIANMYFSVGNYDSAIVYYDKKLSVDSTSISAHVNKALCMIQIKNYDGARISLLDAEQIKPDYMPTLQWLGKTYQYMDSSDAAAATYDKLIALASKDPDKNKTVLGDAYGSKALILLIKKKYAMSVEPLKEALQYDPNNAQYHLWLAQAYALTNRKEDAIREYHKTLQLDPKNPDAKKGLKILE